MAACEQQEEAPLPHKTSDESEPTRNEAAPFEKSSRLTKCWLVACTLLLSCGIAIAVLLWQCRSKSQANGDAVSIAFVGNSMFYFNDFPRFLQRLASPNMVIQDCCLHGGASIPSLLEQGSGMFPQFETDNAILTECHNATIHDYGACTVKQLLLGSDPILLDRDYDSNKDTATGRNLDPCRQDQAYRLFLIDRNIGQQWNYVLINDNTRNPARNATRLASLVTLREKYVPWLLQTGATPVFLWTHAYIPSNGRDMTGLEDVANFTSLTGVGLREYCNLLKQYLPTPQTPRIAPVGLAFLTIYEENREFWKRLFHNADHLHASPSGTFLQGCVVHYTLFGKLPDISMIQSNDNVADLWKTARMMQHAWEPPNPLPSVEDIQYMYSIAKRIANGYIPSTYIHYENGEVAYEG